MVIISSRLSFREWEDTEAHPFCLKPESVDLDAGELSPHFKKVGKMIVDTWNDLHKYKL